MNDQQFFTKAVKHLRAQGVKSIRRKKMDVCGKQTNTQCLYKHVKEDGTVLMCAVGGVLNRDVHRAIAKDPKLNYQFVAKLMAAVPAAKKQLGDVDAALMRSMQQLHDDYKPSQWEAGFRRIGKEYNLKVPE